MTKRITKKVREEAARLAEVGAEDAHRTCALDKALRKATQEAQALYWAAWHHLNAGPFLHHSPISPEHDAAAAELIRSGWSPSDGAP